MGQALKVGRELANLVAAGAGGGAGGAFQRASRQAATGFHVTAFGFDGASAAEVCDPFRCQPRLGPLTGARLALAPRQQHLRSTTARSGGLAGQNLI